MHAGCRCSVCKTTKSVCLPLAVTVTLQQIGTLDKHWGDPTLCGSGNGSSGKLKLVRKALQGVLKCYMEQGVLISFTADCKESLLLE